MVHDDVVVVAHQAVGQHGGIEAVHRLFSHRVQAVPLVVADEDRFAAITP